MRRLRLAQVIVLIAACLAVRGARSAAAQPIWPRAGVVVLTDRPPASLRELGAVWYYRYRLYGEVLPGHRRMLMVRPPYDRAQVATALRRHPGSWWLVGNEPNDPYQDHLSPEAYASFYHRFALEARRLDPTSKLATAGIANADAGWAQAFRENYRAQYGRYPPVDAWNIHNYVLEPERDQFDVAEFQRRILAFRQWMQAVGEGRKPLLLTEMGALYGARDGQAEDPARAAAYVAATVGWLCATDHVQAWAWFADHSAGDFGGDLYDAEGALSAYGRAYRDAVRACGSPPRP